VRWDAWKAAMMAFESAASWAGCSAVEWAVWKVVD
jgi:hypothetical protein